MPSKHPQILKAYKNLDFLNSPAARNIRILTEMMEPADRLRKNNIKNTVVFFGSARTLSMAKAKQALKEVKSQQQSSHPASLKAKIEQAENNLVMARYYEDAMELSAKLTHWFKDVKNSKQRFFVCSGGGPGIMEAANRGAKKAKGQSIGLNISLPMEQHPNPYQDENISFDFHYFFIRKFWFFYLAKALVVFPGGFGTMDELFEILTLIQTEKTKKYMPVVLYGKDYWNELFNFDAMLKWGMISKKDLKLFRCIDSVDESFEYIQKELKKNYFK